MSIRMDRRPHKRLTALSYAAHLFEAIDTPVSLSCAILLRYGEHRQLVEKDINAEDYLDSTSFARDYQAIKLLSRYPYLDTGINRKVVAYKKFVEAEKKCREINTFFREGGFAHLSERAQSTFRRAERKIATILGDVPTLSQLDFAFGPGAAYGVRRDTSVYKKVSAGLECTHAFTGILQEFLEEFPGWIPQGSTHDVNIVPGSQLTVVPKNAKTDRPICIEPLLNGLYQKGVGSWLRRRLKKFGIDLDDQGVNQKLASRAYSDQLATVDFRSASDTIAYVLVMELLPFDWFEFLDVARSPSYEVDGKWYNFHKFTSMGNAYTFELETLIFYALATSACEELGIEYKTGENLSVYGDDVIIPQAAFHLFQEVSEACGFSVNHEKSFSHGSFYESCGHDFFAGEFVRPILLSKELNKLTAAFYAANSVKRIWRRLWNLNGSRVSHIQNRYPLDVGRFHDVHRWVVGCIPPQFRIVGPEGYGDGHLVDNVSKGRSRRHPSWDGWWFNTYIERPSQVKLAEVPSGYALYFNRSTGSDVVSVRDHLLLRDYMKNPDAPRMGTGYGLRGKTQLVLVKVWCQFIWQDLDWCPTKVEPKWSH